MRLLYRVWINFLGVFFIEIINSYIELLYIVEMN